MKQAVRLRPGREKAIKNRHHWIFSGAIASSPSFTDGDLLPVESHEGEFLGIGYFNSQSTIRGRMITFDQQDPIDAIANNMTRAYQLRQKLIGRDTNAYRLIHGEGDFLPGLVVDLYGDVAVLQVATKGMEKLAPVVIAQLKKMLPLRAIYEKSNLPSRKDEGLPPCTKLHEATIEEPLLITEKGHKFAISIPTGQKTGFFLDQRENRERILELAKDKRVLNCFCYNGGFTVYALAGGATLVDSVDLSEPALQLAEESLRLNNQKGKLIAADVFTYLRENPIDYDLVILDPPAFAKRKSDQVAACRGYKHINRIAMQKMPKGSFL